MSDASGHLEAPAYPAAMERLVAVVQTLSCARDLDTVTGIVRSAARDLTGADGATFVLRDGDLCFYADEDAIAPLWKGRRFPMSACISGWTMLNRRQVVIEDIYADARIPHDAYRPTFVKSLAMVPIRSADPIGAIGNYWASTHVPSPEQMNVLQALADTTAVALENVHVYAELERRVRERTAQLEAANKDLESFSYSISHDLRAPIRAVSGFCKLMFDDHEDELDEEALRKLGVIRDEAERMGRMAEGLLTFSRLGRGALQPAEVDMTELVRGVFARLERDEARPIEFVLRPLPRAHADAKLIEQVLTNLLSNAVKFCAREQTARIIVDGALEEDNAVYSVCDNGVGFDPRYQEKLFEVFHRLHHQDEFPGTGVGLSLVHKIVSRHGGRVWAEGQPNRGATFHFTLPKAEAAGNIDQLPQSVDTIDMSAKHVEKY